MVEELLDVQRIEAGVLALELSRFDLGAARRARRGRAPGHDQPSTALVAEAASVEVVADRRRVEEVLTNLIENAIKYSPEGGEVRVRVAAEGRTALVEVVDQGIGISAEDQARVFDRFFRASGAGERLHRGHHGLGLGLYIARELVQRHGGEMGVRSTAGAGSVFWFRLPLDGPEPAADRPGRNEKTPAGIISRRGSARRLADDYLVATAFGLAVDRRLRRRGAADLDLARLRALGLRQRQHQLAVLERGLGAVGVDRHREREGPAERARSCARARARSGSPRPCAPGRCRAGR